MREYGGYIELYTFRGKMLHEGAIELNCGRNALAYLCESRKIKKLYLPYYLCSSVPELCNKIGVAYTYYHINSNFEPIFEDELAQDEWLYIVNFFGQLNNEFLLALKNKYNRIIVDNAQGYFQMPVTDVDTIYTCRKYFGVSDGAFLYTNTRLNREIPRDESFERMHFLLGRYERSANEFYSEYVANNKLFTTEPIKRMSHLTKNLLKGIDYESVSKCRTDNFALLHKEFCKTNVLKLSIPNGAFMYPLYVENGMAIRKILQQEKIYIPTLWPSVFEECSPDSLEYCYAANILPIPVDQRYGPDDMKYFVEVINRVLLERT